MISLLTLVNTFEKSVVIENKMKINKPSTIFLTSTQNAEKQYFLYLILFDIP
jgi:hypothetical protein